MQSYLSLFKTQETFSVCMSVFANQKFLDICLFTLQTSSMYRIVIVFSPFPCRKFYQHPEHDLLLLWLLLLLVVVMVFFFFLTSKVQVYQTSYGSPITSSAYFFIQTYRPSIVLPLVVYNILLSVLTHDHTSRLIFNKFIYFQSRRFVSLVSITTGIVITL